MCVTPQKLKNNHEPKGFLFMFLMFSTFFLKKILLLKNVFSALVFWLREYLCEGAMCPGEGVTDICHVGAGN